MSDFDPKDLHPKSMTPSSDFNPKDIHPDNEKFSQGESLLGGLQQGVTMGASDEMAGGIQALLNQMPGSPTDVNKQLQSQGFTGDLGPTSTLELYQQARDAERQKNEALKAANSKMFTAGEIGGGVLSSAAMPGALAQSPAALGAMYGLGNSKADVTKGDVLGAMGDTALGAGEAKAMQLGIKGLVGAGKYVGNKISNTQAVQDMLDAYRASKAGNAISGQVENYTKELNKKAQDLYKQLKAGAVKSTEARQKALNDASSSKVNLKDVLRQVRSEAEVMPTRNDIEKQSKQTLLNLLDENFSKNSAQDLSPQEAQDAIQAIKKYTPMGEKPIADPDFAKKALQASQMSEEQLGQAVPIQNLNSDISNHLSMSEALAKENPFDKISMGEAPGVIEGISKKLQKISTDPRAKIQADELVNEGFMNPQTGRKVPALKDFNPDAANTMNSAQNTSRLLDLSKKASSGGPLEMGGVKGAEIAGDVVRGVQSTAPYKVANQAKDFVTQGAKKLSDLGNEDVRNLVGKGMQQFGKNFEPYANILSKADTANPVSRNAMIFSLMQRPDFREMMRSIMGDEAVQNENP